MYRKQFFQAGGEEEEEEKGEGEVGGWEQQMALRYPPREPRVVRQPGIHPARVENVSCWSSVTRTTLPLPFHDGRLDKLWYQTIASFSCITST